MRYLRIVVCITAIVLPLTASAQTGPCNTGTACPVAGHICVGAEGSRLCYQPCNPAAASGATDACPAGQTCRRPTGITQDVCELATPAGASAEPVGEEPAEVPFVPITPQLGVPIPGAEALTPPTRVGEEVVVSFLAQYINAVYRYLTAIILVVAIVMCVYGGFLYLAGSAGVGSIQRGKQIITDAIMGMIITLAAFAILNTVNPDTTNLKVLKLAFVNTVEIDFTLGDTLVSTALDDGSDNPTGSTGAVAGSHTPSTTSCPFTLSATTGRAGLMAFQAGMQSSRALTATTPRARILQVADIADACDINFGSCGTTVGTIYALAGAGRNVSCLNSTPRNTCNGNYGSETFSVSATQRAYFAGLRCKEGGFNVGGRIIQADVPCEATSAEATRNVRDYLIAQRDAGSADLAGWPDSWANSLQPGDYVVIYNGNIDYMGSHAVVFVGWSGDRMQVIQGGAGSTSDVARSGSWCVKSGCGDNMYPLTYIRTP